MAATVGGPDYEAWVAGLSGDEVTEIFRQVNTRGSISAEFVARLSEELDVRPAELLAEGPGGVEYYEPPLDLVIAINNFPPADNHHAHRFQHVGAEGPGVQDAAVDAEGPLATGVDEAMSEATEPSAGG